MGAKDRLERQDDRAERSLARWSRVRAPRSASPTRCDQEHVDEVVTAAGWAIVDPDHNRALAELAVRDTGLGNVADKIAKNRRKTIGLLRDLARREIGRRHRRGPRARPDRDRAAGRRGRCHHAVDQSGRDARQQHHQRAEGPQRDHPRAVAQGALARGALLLEYVHAELDRIGAPRDLVQQLPAPVTREATARADAPGRSRRRDGLADQRARRVLERHAGDRRRRRQRRR